MATQKPMGECFQQMDHSSEGSLETMPGDGLANQGLQRPLEVQSWTSRFVQRSLKQGGVIAAPGATKSP